MADIGIEDISKADFNAANSVEYDVFERRPRVETVGYDIARGRLVFMLAGDFELSFKPDRIRGLEKASDSQLSNMTIGPFGLSVQWPDINTEVYLPALMQGHRGSGNRTAEAT